MLEFPHMSRFAQTLFRHLRQIDSEVVTRPDGVPTGIRWYCGHNDPNLSLHAVSRVEDLWSARLAALCQGHGLAAESRVAYPATRQRCELVVTSRRGKRFWIEVKGAWTEYVF